MNPLLGAALDKANVAFRWIRYVAQGDGFMAQQKRFDEVMERYARRRDAETEPGDRDLTLRQDDLAAMLARINVETRASCARPGGKLPERPAPCSGASSSPKR